MTDKNAPKFMGFSLLGEAVYEIQGEDTANVQRRLAARNLVGEAAMHHIASPGDSYTTVLLDTDHEDARWIRTDHEVATGWEAIAVNPTAPVISALHSDVSPER